MTVPELYISVSGTSSDAYDLADAVDIFLVDVLGWTRQHTVASGALCRDRAYTNSGGELDNINNTLYCRVEAISGTIFNHLYTYYAFGGGSFAEHITGYGNTANVATLSGTVHYKLIGNRNVFWLLAGNPLVAGTGVYSSSIGYCNTYYNYEDDPYPACLVGQSSPEADFLSDRVMMYDKDLAGIYYHAENYSLLTQCGAPQSRNGMYFGMPIALAGDGVGNEEMRGELRGIRQIYGSGFSTGDTIDAVSPAASGTYYVVKHDDSRTFLYGPYEEM